jgi:hypothetical protein
MLPHPISDRVKELRAEIATIHHANHLYQREKMLTRRNPAGNGGLNDCVALWTS